MALRQLNTLNKTDVHVDGNDCERLLKAHKDSGCIRIHRHVRSERENLCKLAKTSTLQFLSSSLGPGTSAQVWFWRVSEASV